MAWFIFNGLRHKAGRWDWIVGGMSAPRRTGLKLEAIREYAGFHGIEVDGDLLDRIEIFEEFQLQRDAMRATTPATDEATETVN